MSKHEVSWMGADDSLGAPHTDVLHVPECGIRENHSQHKALIV